jgi:glutathione-regulated potassium-efflux system ancillary protein KefG
MAPLKITVLFFHPYPRRSKTNRILWRAIQDCEGVESRDLYELYPDFSIDVEREQEVLLKADVIVFQHPLYWYSCPSLMKEWIDTVLEKGWAYGPGGNYLQGKYWQQVITSGGTPSTYTRLGDNRFSIFEFLRPFEQSAKLCGMIPLTPFITHSARNLSDEVRHQKASTYREMLIDMARGKLPTSYNTEQGEEIQL